MGGKDRPTFLEENNSDVYKIPIFQFFLLIASQNVLAEINAPKYVFKGGQNNTSSKNVYHGGSINNNQAPQQQIARNDNNTQNQVDTAANPYYVPNGEILISGLI